MLHTTITFSTFCGIIAILTVSVFFAAFLFRLLIALSPTRVNHEFAGSASTLPLKQQRFAKRSGASRLVASSR